MKNSGPHLRNKHMTENWEYTDADPVLDLDNHCLISLYGKEQLEHLCLCSTAVTCVLNRLFTSVETHHDSLSVLSVLQRDVMSCVMTSLLSVNTEALARVIHEEEPDSRPEHTDDSNGLYSCIQL